MADEGGYTGRRIAVEEGYLTAEASAIAREFMASSAARTAGWYGPNQIMRQEIAEARWRKNDDVGEGRLAEMDAAGIDMQVLVLAYNGSQMFDPKIAVEATQRINDGLAEIVQKHPDRFAGLASLPTQHPEAAARELERVVRTLGLKGAVIHSHTRGADWPQHGEYLDDPKFQVLFEAAEALDAPIYLHPSIPSPQMVGPYRDSPLIAAMWGYSAEAAVHTMRLILAGVFDRFPKLTLVVGHLGEGIPFFFERLDYWFGLAIPNVELQYRPSEYFFRNIYVTTSGMNKARAVAFCHSVLGADRIMFAADYPQEPLEQEVHAIDTIPLPPGDREKIYHLNAERVFKL